MLQFVDDLKILLSGTCNDRYIYRLKSLLMLQELFSFVHHSLP